MSEQDTPTLPASKHAYSFDDVTRELLGHVEVFLSPLEGEYFLPRNVVDIAPPANIDTHQYARLNQAATAWDVVHDYRRVMLWDTTTARPVPNTLALGDALPEGMTAEAPPVFSDHEPLLNLWDPTEQAWRQAPDYSRTPVWSKATALRAPSPAPGEALPDSLTTRMPPRADVHQAPRWNTQQDDWELVADYRGFVYWTADGAQHVIDHLGIEPPDGYLTQPPTDDVTSAEPTTP